jgi:hypothetical protein
MSQFPTEKKDICRILNNEDTAAFITGNEN